MTVAQKRSPFPANWDYVEPRGYDVPCLQHVQAVFSPFRRRSQRRGNGWSRLRISRSYNSTIMEFRKGGRELELIWWKQNQSFILQYSPCINRPLLMMTYLMRWPLQREFSAIERASPGSGEERKPSSTTYTHAFVHSTGRNHDTKDWTSPTPLNSWQLSWCANINSWWLNHEGNIFIRATGTREQSGPFASSWAQLSLTTPWGRQCLWHNNTQLDDEFLAWGKNGRNCVGGENLHGALFQVCSITSIDWGVTESWHPGQYNIGGDVGSW